MSSDLEKVLAKAKELAELMERDREELVKKFEELSKRIEEDAKRFSSLSPPPAPSPSGGKTPSSKK